MDVSLWAVQPSPTGYGFTRYGTRLCRYYATSRIVDLIRGGRTLSLPTFLQHGIGASFFGKRFRLLPHCERPFIGLLGPGVALFQRGIDAHWQSQGQQTGQQTASAAMRKTLPAIVGDSREHPPAFFMKSHFALGFRREMSGHGTPFSTSNEAV